MTGGQQCPLVYKYLTINLKKGDIMSIIRIEDPDGNLMKIFILENQILKNIIHYFANLIIINLVNII